MNTSNAKSIPSSPAYTFTSAGVALLAILSLLAIAAAHSSMVTKSIPLSDTAGDSAFVTLVPHLLVLALLATGFRRTGDVVALPVALLVGAGSALIALVTPGSAMAVVVLLQIAMLVVALIDLAVGRRAELPLSSPRVRLLGLLGVSALAFFTDRVAAAPAKEELARRATLTPRQRAGELGAVIDPSPHLPDSVRLKQRPEWIDYSVLGRVFGMANCIEQFRGDSGGPYPRSLGELKAWSLRDTSSYSMHCAAKLTRSTRDSSLFFFAPEDGHVIRYTPPTGAIDRYRPAAFTLETEAVWDSALAQHALSRAGLRNYLLDSAGNVHFTDEHRRATLRDPLRPRCDPPEEYKEIAECVVSYPPRERWGAYQLPRASVQMASSVHPGEEFSPMLQYWPTYAIDSVARVTVDWGDGAPNAVEDVPPVSERSYGTHHDWNRTVRHVYRAPGTYQLQAAFTTRNGDVWKTSRPVSVTRR